MANLVIACSSASERFFPPNSLATRLIALARSRSPPAPPPPAEEASAADDADVADALLLLLPALALASFSAALTFAAACLPFMPAGKGLPLSLKAAL